METGREEAAPTFPTWRQRLEQATEESQPEELERFLQVLKAVGTPMIDGSTVHFIYYDPQAQRVAVTGEFNQWDRRGTALTPLKRTGIFYRTLEFRGPVRVEYKFIVDGEWMVDPFCPQKIDNGIGEQNSYFVVGDLRDPPEVEWISTIPHGRVEEFDFKSKLLHNQRRVYVYLPPGYDEHSDRRFPALYVHDGGEYLTRARLPTILDNLIHSQDIPQLMAVMVDPVDRIREYWANEGYARFTEEELLPHIDDRYRTLARREGRGVIGASMGGLVSTYLGLSRAHLFSKVGGQSSALFLMDGERGAGLAQGLLSRFAVSHGQWGEPKRLATLIADLRAPVAFYFDVGKYEPQFIPAHHKLVPQLEAKGCPCFFQELVGGHNWTSWRAHLKDLLTFLWKDSVTQVQESARPAVNETPASMQEETSPRPGLDRLFVRFFNGWDGLFPRRAMSSQWSPVVESTAVGGRLLFKVALPSIEPQDIGLLAIGRQLILTGVRRDAPAQGDGTASAGESHDSWFERVFPLPEGVAADTVTACYHNGVLEITMPAPEGVVVKRVAIEVK